MILKFQVFLLEFEFYKFNFCHQILYFFTEFYGILNRLLIGIRWATPQKRIHVMGVLEEK